MGRQTLHCHPCRPQDYFASKFSKALASSVTDTTMTYSSAHFNSHAPLTIDLQSRVVHGNSFPYRDQLADAGFSWCPPSWRFLTKEERRARPMEKYERDHKLAQEAQEMLQLDLEYQEQQRLLQAEREIQAQR